MNYLLKNQNIYLDEKGVKVLDAFEETIIPWESVSYAVEQKHYVSRTSSRGRAVAYALKKVYKFYNGDKFLFYIDTYFENKEILNSIKENFIDTKIIKEKKDYVDGQEVIKLSYNNNTIIEIIVIILCYILVGVMIAIMSSWDYKIEGPMTVAAIMIMSIPFAYFYIKTELNQKNQKVFLIKGKGIQIEKAGKKTFYKFSEIDEGVAECYILEETVDNKIRLYKNKEKILVVTNSNNGFYEFLDELKSERIIK